MAKKKKNKNRRKHKPYMSANASPWNPRARFNGVRRYLAPVKKKKVKEFGTPVGKTFKITGAIGFPSVVLSGVAHGKMLALVKRCPIEISWMSSVTREENGDYRVHDVYVPLQSCGPASTVISEDGDSEMLMELLGAGKPEEISRLHCWGHSHVNMGVFPSGVDTDQTDDFLTRCEDFFVRFIANKRGELLCHVFCMKTGMILHNPPLIVEHNEIKYKDWADEQIELKVTKQTYVAPTRTYVPPSGGVAGHIGIGAKHADVAAIFAGESMLADQGQPHEIWDAEVDASTDTFGRPIEHGDYDPLLDGDPIGGEEDVSAYLAGEERHGDR